MRAAPADFPFDAVLFDLDGTLVATERYWPDAAREACLEAFPRLGIEREIPPAAVWMHMVGLPLQHSFDAVFADLEPDTRARLMAACVAREHEYLARGRAALLPGVEHTLAELRRRGVRLGIASNCSRDYLDAMLYDVGLGRWIEEGRCLASPRVRDKADMVEDLLATFDTRSAVMVGDREGDRDAAWENGLPHVHVDRGYAGTRERVAAEAVLDGMDQLLPRLLERDAWLDRILARLAPRPGSVLGVTGHTGAGKSLVARDLARRLAASGRRAAVVALDAFELGADERDRRGDPRAPELALAHEHDVEALVRDVLRPHADAEAVALERQDGEGRTRRILVPRDAVLVLEGRFLTHPDLRGAIDRLLYLLVSDEVALRRVRGREGRSAGLAAVDRARRRRLPAEAAFDARFPPQAAADLVVVADNPLGP